MKKNKIKLFVTLSFALLMAFGNVNSVSAAKSTTKSTPYGTLKGFISPYNSGSSNCVKVVPLLVKMLNLSK